MREQGLIRLSTWLGDELGLPRLLALGLLLAGLNSVALGLAALVQGLDLSLLLPLTILGLLLGWGLAMLPWPGWLAGTLALMLGLVAALVRVGRLGGLLLTWLGSLLAWGWQVWRWPVAGPPDSQPPVLLLAELSERFNALLNRLVGWLLGLAMGEPTFDPVAVAVVWSLTLWLVAAWAGWMVRQREQPLLGLLPAGALLLITQAYAGGNFAFLLLLLAVLWFLLALVSYTARERRWQAAGLDFSLDIRLDTLFVTIWLVLALVTLAGITPAISLQQLADLAQRLLWGQPLSAGPVANSLGLKPLSGQPTAFDRVRTGGLPRQHLLGSGPELSQQVVLLIRLDNGWGVAGQRATPSGEDVPAQLGAPLRWRSLAYDRYSGFGWQAGQTEIVSYGAGEPAGAQTCEVCETSQVLQVRQEVQVVGDLGGLIYAAGQLVTVDQAYSVAYRTGDDAFGATTAATAYRADSLVALPTEAELRAAGSSYPRWVQRRYLALPAKLPKRVLALARDLTATEATPYDRAKAIETYLRTIPYNLDIPAPPVNRDVVDYFLFDLRQGYCDYYATAMVVLARAAGLPARLVIGYASGAYDAAANRYVVSAANAHSWPEIYFPGYGWIEFEPTANQAVMARPAEIRPLTPAVEIPAAEVAPLAGTGLSRWWIWGWGVSAGLAGLALAGLAWSVADAWWLAHLPPAATVERLYQRLRRYGRRLAVPTGAGDTPYEFRAALAGRLAHLAQGRRWARLLAPAAPEVAGLTDLYVQAAYSAHPPGPTDRQQAVQTWRRLRLRLWLAWGLHVILRPQAEES